MAHRTFTAATTAPEREPVTFRLEGVVAGEHWHEDFTCVPVPPAGVLDDLLRSIRSDSRGRMNLDGASVLDFITGVLVPADVDRFEALVHDKVRVVPFEQLGDLVDWLQEELFGRPTSPA